MRRDAVGKEGTGPEWCGKTVKRDRDIVKAGLISHGTAPDDSEKASERDLDIVKAAVIQNGLALKYAHTRAKGTSTSSRLPGPRT